MNQITKLYISCAIGISIFNILNTFITYGKKQSTNRAGRTHGDFKKVGICDADEQ